MGPMLTVVWLLRLIVKSLPHFSTSDDFDVYDSYETASMQYRLEFPKLRDANPFDTKLRELTET